jgi:hypothetical protein
MHVYVATENPGSSKGYPGDRQDRADVIYNCSGRGEAGSTEVALVEGDHE